MEVKDYLDIVRARKWIIIQAVIIVTLVAVGVSLLQRPTYKGEAEVLVAENNADSSVFGSVLAEFSSQPERGLQTQVRLMQMRPLAEDAVRDLGLKMTPKELLGKIEVAAVGQTNVISISATDGNAKRAAAIANGLAQSYVDWSRSAKSESVQAAVDEVQRRLSTAKTDVMSLGQKITDQRKPDDLNAQLSQATNLYSTQVNRLVELRMQQQAATSTVTREAAKTAADDLQVQIDTNKQQIVSLGNKMAGNGTSDEMASELAIATGLYATLADKLEQLRVNQELETGSGRIVSPAVIDPVPVSPQPTRNGLLGLAVGLVFGLGMAFLAEHLDNTIKSRGEAEQLYGAPVLAQIPAERFEKGEQRRLTIVLRPGSPAAEAYRVLRNGLDFMNFERNIKTLLVASSAPGEGKSTVASNLAAGLAQAGSKVVLINCDFRRPTTDQFFDVNNMLGLSDVLRGTMPLDAALQSTKDENLQVLTSGKMPPNPSELLGSSKMSELIESLKERVDWVVVDSPPLLAVADSTAAVRWADGVLMVTRGGSSTREAAKSGREMLENVGARIVGVVVWGLEDSVARKGYGYGYYGSYYSGYYDRSGSTRGSEPDSGAKGTPSEQDAASVAEPVTDADGGYADTYMRTMDTGRRSVELMGRIVAGVLAFLVVLAIIVAAAYLLDGYFGWGLVQSVVPIA